MKFIRKALWPTAIVAAVLMLFGALGSAINADTLGDVQSSTGDNVVEAGTEVAIYVVVSADATTESAQQAAVRDAVDALAGAGTDLESEASRWPSDAQGSHLRRSRTLELISPLHSIPPTTCGLQPRWRYRGHH